MQNCCLTRPQSRRGALKTIALGGGASLLLAGRAFAGHCDVLLLSCMDYRLIDDLVTFMDSRGLQGNYDHVILAGASLGAVTDKMPDWGHTFWEHLDTAIQLHHIKKVMVIDHRDCGAYKLLLGDAAVKDPATELASHTEELHRLRALIKTKHADLEVELGLMELTGEVAPIA
jgi:carbonic anhydrase